MTGTHAGGAAATGILLLTFGSAVTSADVPAYLRSVRGGREPSAELRAEFARRFDLIGRSPLIDITLQQAAALQQRLDVGARTAPFRVAAGMLHSEPSVGTAIEGLVERGVGRIISIVLAPQYSPLILSGYERTLEREMARVAPSVPASIAGAWHLVPGWIDSLAARVIEGLRERRATGANPAVIFTAHSLPRPVVERDPSYMEQIHETIDAVAARAGLGQGDWLFAYQSAGHTPEEWLKPDLLDVLPAVRQQGRTSVLVVPVQFVADHLEVLYDIDIAAAEQARAAGLSFSRIAMPNAAPAFIEALAQVVTREGAAAPV